MKNIFLIMGLYGWAFIAYAGFHVEPYAGLGGAYISFDRQADFAMPLMAGGRVGYKILNITAGGDVFITYFNPRGFSIPNVVVNKPSRASGLSQAGENTSVLYSQSTVVPVPVSFGLFAAVGVPLLVDVYGGLFYSLTLDKKYKGLGVKAGLTYLSAFFISCNMEFQWVRYSCSRENCPPAQSLALMLSLSMPFSFNLFKFSSKGDRSNAGFSGEEEQGYEAHSLNEDGSSSSTTFDSQDEVDSLSYE